MNHPLCLKRQSSHESRHRLKRILYLRQLLLCRICNADERHSPKFSFQKMALGGTAPPRGSAAATASMRRRRTAGGAASGGAAGNMLQFYTDDAPGLKISPNVVLVMSIGFIAFVAILHVMGKLYFVRREA
ncbi:hypothetical protein VNO78_25513 [Psophocarpus tetragonolobus]|uniref:Protein transport protein Sec61 subunit beta n=1 Tax=Psophocarpus tetragonolobus TaxID=3891 RepID=A0AAN9S612_PSOTE